MENQEDTMATALVLQMNQAPWYVGSTAIHMLMFLFLLLIPIHHKRSIPKHIMIISSVIEDVSEDVEDIIEEEVQEVAVDNPIITDSVPVIVSTEIEVSDHFESDDDMNDNDSLGDSDALYDVDTEDKGSPALMGIGHSGGAGGGGQFGNRRGGNKRRTTITNGGAGTINALNSALKWLAEHQESDGHWDCQKYGGGLHDTGDHNDIGVTSLSLLAFLGAGNSNRFGKYRHNVELATLWLINQQHKNGMIGFHRYQSGIATMALVEAFGMGDKTIRPQAQSAVEWAVASQNDSGGWDYSPNSSRTDMSVSGWWIMAIKSAKVSGLYISNEVFENALKYIRTWTTNEGKGTYDISKAKGSGSHRMYAIPLVCLEFLGVKRNDAMVQASVKGTMQNLPNPKKFDFYNTYYQALGIFQMGVKSDYWQKFNPLMKNMLLTTQVKLGSYQENKGSWNPDTDQWGSSWSRVGQTALGALMLEIYYRYKILDGKR